MLPFVTYRTLHTIKLTPVTGSGWLFLLANLLFIWYNHWHEMSSKGFYCARDSPMTKLVVEVHDQAKEEFLRELLVTLPYVSVLSVEPCLIT